MKWIAIIVIAIVVEGIMEYLKQAVPKLAGKTALILGITVALGVAAALTFNADIFAVIGIPAKIPYIGCVLTGILCGRGSNYIYDIVGKFTDANKILTEAEREAERYLAALNGEDVEPARTDEPNADAVSHEKG